MSKAKVKMISKSEKYLVKNALVNYYLALMFTFFPLFVTQSYANIRHDKLYFFTALSGVLIAVETIILVVALLTNRDKSGVAWYRRLSVTDISFTLFVLFAAVSTVMSDYPLDSLSGAQGRNNGFLLILVYFAVYIIISRLFVYRKYVFLLMTVASIAVFALCILNFFSIDPLGMYEGFDSKVRNDFISTLGNKNIMSCYCCVIVPAILVLFINSVKPAFSAIYLIGAGLGFAAMLCADSESGFLGFVPMLAFVLLYYCRKPDKLFLFFAALSVMLLFAKLLSFFVGHKTGDFGEIQRAVISGVLTWVLVAVFAFLAVIMRLISVKKSVTEFPKAVFVILSCFYALVITSLIGCFIYFTFIDRETKLTSALSYFRFGNRWGTHRGYMWKRGFEIFCEYDFGKILFGSGPDTVYSVFSPFFPQLYKKFGDVSTNAVHNELLNYLLTNGALGLAAYLTWIISAVVRAVKKSFENMLALVFIMPVICYFFQSIVNIATPITTPLMIIFLALAENISSKE